MRTWLPLAVAAAAATAGPATAGLHLSCEPLRELPADWRGFFPDHRTLAFTGAPDGPPAALRNTYADNLLRLQAGVAGGAPSADAAADLGGLHVRLGRPDKAVGVLRAAARRFPDHPRIAANLGTAYQVSGDLTAAEDALADAVRLAPPGLREAERYHLRLVRLRRAERGGSDAGPDDLFGVTYSGRPGEPPTSGRLPPDAVAIVQRLALWLPNDGRLLWQLGELANAAGDVATAAAVLDRCAAEHGLRSAEFVARRRAYRAASVAREAAGTHARPAVVAFRSSRPLARTFDISRLPAVDPTGVNPLPWAAVAETEVGRGFRPAFHSYVAELDGKRVSVAGYARPSDGGGWLLTEGAIGCWFCEAPMPNRMIVVDPGDDGLADPGRGCVKITGVLRLNRRDPERPLMSIDSPQVGPVD